MLRIVNRLRAKSWDELAFLALSVSVVGMALSLPLGRFFLALTVFCLVMRGVREGVHWRFPPVAWVGFAFLVLLSIVTVYGANPHIGIPRLNKLIWFIGLPATAAVVTSRERALVLLKIYIVAVSVLALQLLIETPLDVAALLRAEPGVPCVDAVIRVASMTDAQRLAVGVIAGLGVLLGIRGARWRRVLPFLLLLMAAALLVTFKRGSWLCALMMITVLLAARRQWRLLVALFVLAGAVSLAPPVRHRMSTIKLQLDLDAGGRLTMWTWVMPRMRKYYPWGVGYRSLTNEMIRGEAPQVERLRDHLHSNPVQLLVAGGWLGLGLYLLWMGWGLVDAVRGVRLDAAAARDGPAVAWIILCMYGALLLNGLVEYNFGDAEVVLLYGWIMGTAAAAPGWLRTPRSAG